MNPGNANTAEHDTLLAKLRPTPDDEHQQRNADDTEQNWLPPNNPPWGLDAYNAEHNNALHAKQVPTPDDEQDTMKDHRRADETSLARTMLEEEDDGRIAAQDDSVNCNDDENDDDSDSAECDLLAANQTWANTEQHLLTLSTPPWATDANSAEHNNTLR